MAFLIENNLPSAGCIRWSNLHMQYLGVNYTIVDGYTNYIYIYWTPTTPNNLVITNTFPVLGDDDCLLFLNKNGIAVTVPGSTIMEGDLIVPGSIVANAIAANTITGDKIKADTITANNLAVGAITSKTIATGAINATGMITANTITGDRMVVDTITAREIAAKSITANEILAATITAAEIAALTITAAKIAANTITVAQLVGTIGTDLNLSSNTSITSKVTQAQVDTSITAGISSMSIGSINLITDSQNISIRPNNTGKGTSVKVIDEATPYFKITATDPLGISVYEDPIYAYMQANCIVGNKYTLSVEIRAASLTNVGFQANLGVKPIAPANKWVKISYTFTYVAGTRYAGLTTPLLTLDYRNWKLENGSLATDWTPTPNEISDAIAEAAASGDSANSRLDTAETTITQNTEDILLSATSSELDALSGVVTAQGTAIGLTDSKINLAVASVKTAADDANDAIEYMQTYIDFSAGGLVLGQSGGVNDNLKVKITNADMQFLDNGVAAASITGQVMTIDKAKIGSSIIVGNHIIEKYDANITIIKWIG